MCLALIYKAFRFEEIQVLAIYNIICVSLPLFLKVTVFGPFSPYQLNCYGLTKISQFRYEKTLLWSVVMFLAVIFNKQAETT